MENAANEQNRESFEKEKAVLRLIKEHFPAADIESARVAARKIYFSAGPELFSQLLVFVARELGFSHLCTITGIDNLDSFEFLYHVSNEDGILFTLKLKTPREDGTVIDSVLPIYNGAAFYERELEGLLGVKVRGLPEGRQYPLPDNWPKGQYPLRKDWAQNQSDKDAGGKEGE